MPCWTGLPLSSKIGDLPMQFNPTGQIIAGLTGGIASGKSTVSRMLDEAGARIVDADHHAHLAVRKGQPAWQDIVQHFGSTILQPDGEIDRNALAAIVFNEKKAKAALNEMVHPRVSEAMQKDIETIAANHPGDLIVLDVPLLIESGWHEAMPIVILVYVPEQTQRIRLMQRDGLTASDAEARIRAQMPIDAKREHADFIIDNSGHYETTRDQVVRIYRQIHPLGKSPA